MKKTNKIQKLIDNQLTKKEQEDLVNEIRNSTDLKLELALLLRIKKNHREDFKRKMKEQIQNGAMTIAASYLTDIKEKAAFSGDIKTDEPILPIDEETINDFLNDN
jgi:hypothetical protein